MDKLIIRGGEPLLGTVRVSGAKSDPFDAQVLALFLRSDHLQLRPLRPNSEAAQELKGLTRDYRRQVHLQTRLLNSSPPR